MSAPVYLISTTRLKEVSEIHANVDDKILKRAITVAQDVYLESILGTRLLNHIKSLLPTTILSGNAAYKTLLDDYIEPTLIYYSLLEGLDLIAFKLTNKGVLKREAEEAQPALSDERRGLINNYKEKAEHYGDRLVRYLVANSTTLPEYSESPADLSELPGRKDTFHGGFYF